MMALAIATAATSALGALADAGSKAGQYEAQGQAADYNAQISEANAGTARREAGAAEDLQRRRAAQVLAQQRGGRAQQPVDPSTGSAADVYRQSMEDAELDALNIRYGGEQRARGFLNQAESERFQGRVARANAKGARRQGYFNAASSILSSIGGYYSGQARQAAAMAPYGGG